MRDTSAVSIINESLRRYRESPVEPTFERLLASARELFTTEGFRRTSLDDVAAAGGVTKGSVYHHFSSKTELFEAVFEDEARRLCERVAEVIARKRDPWQAAFTGVDEFLAASQEPAVQRIMLLDAPSVLGWARVREIEANYGLALIKAALAQLIDAKLISRHDVDLLAHLLFGAMSEGALLIARAANEEGARRKVERELRQLLRGLASSEPGD
jgi:AcrR family transcriptional regulator